MTRSDLRARARGLPRDRRAPSSTRRSCRSTSSGRRTASSTARSGARPARRACSCFRRRRGVRRRRDVTDFRYNVVLAEEMTRARRLRLRLPAAQRHDRALPRRERDTDEQKQRWLPGLRAPARSITAIAMTEPGAGSDLQGIRTTRRRRGRPLRPQRLEDLHLQRHPRRPGDRGRAHRPRRRPQGHQPARRRARHGGLRARPQPRQDRPARPGHRRAVLRPTSRVPEGEPARRGGRGLRLPDDEPRPGAALDRRSARSPPCEARARDVASTTPRTREAFGRPIGKFQHNRFLLAEMATEAHIARVFIDDCVRPALRGELDTDDRVDGEVVDHRAAEQDRRPAACSSTAATAT